MSADDRMLELLTEQTERPLSGAERAELERLLEANPKWRATDFELAAASSALAFLGDTEEMPSHLIDRVMTSLDSTVDRADTITMPAQVAEPEPRPEPDTKATPMPKPKLRHSRLTQYGGWMAAAAAILVLVLVLWPKPKPPPATPAQARSMLLAQGAKPVSWSNTDDPLSKGAEGDVVWDNKTQTGYMRFSGLRKNDPTRNQYQLWIFDGTRPSEHPIDGGVFDVNADGEVIVPIDAKIKVFEPTMFAVTLEKPGGVVVSKRERLVVLAKVSS